MVWCFCDTCVRCLCRSLPVCEWRAPGWHVPQAHVVLDLICYVWFALALFSLGRLIASHCPAASQRSSYLLQWYCGQRWALTATNRPIHVPAARESYEALPVLPHRRCVSASAFPVATIVFQVWRNTVIERCCVCLPRFGRYAIQGNAICCSQSGRDSGIPLRR